MPSFCLSFADVWSRLDNMELRVPVAKEKAMTPITMSTRQMIFSCVVPPEMSPNPTVVIVVTVKYNETTYSYALAGFFLHLGG